MKYTIIVFLLFVFNNFNICHANYFEVGKVKLKHTNANGIEEIIVSSAGFSRSFKITQVFYDNLKNHLESFKNTNYYIYNSSLKEQNIEEVKSCNLMNFNQNYISKIYLIRAKPIYNKDENGTIISAKFGFEENYVILNVDKEIKFKIRDASEYCDKIKIENCNKDGKSGIECLKLLPENCEFVVSSNYGSHCINLKTEEYKLVEFGCDNKGCQRMSIPVEYGN